jgi:hypothetical protein
LLANWARVEALHRPSIVDLGDPADHRAAAHGLAATLATLDQVVAGETSVQRVAELEVPVTHEHAGRAIHVRPGVQRRERPGKRGEAGPKRRDQGADPRHRLGPEPELDERLLGLLLGGCRREGVARCQ